LGLKGFVVVVVVVIKGIAACFLCQFYSDFKVYHKPGYNILVSPAHAKTSMTTEYMEVKYGLKGVCKSSKILDPQTNNFPHPCLHADSLPTSILRDSCLCIQASLRWNQVLQQAEYHW